MSIDSYPIGFLLIVFCTSVAVGGLLLTRRMINPEKFIAAHGISGNFLSIVGTMYAVLLGLIVVHTMIKFQKATRSVEQEVDHLRDVVYLGDGLSPEHRRKVRELAIRYAQLVPEREWKRLSNGEHDPQARSAVLALMRLVRDWEPNTEREKAIYAAVVESATKLWNARRVRLVIARQGIPALVWFTVIVGGIVTLGFTYIFVFEEIRLQLALTFLVSLLIALNIYLIAMFGYPFSGDLQVAPDCFHETIRLIQEIPM